MLFGTTADVAVYVGASVRLVHGALPYRDFVFIQPPGFTLLATPFAFLSELVGTRDALAVLRLCTPLIAVGSVLLVGRITRPYGRPAVLLACGVMALYPAQLYALQDGLLEPVMTIFCLIGIGLAFSGESFTTSPRRLGLAGAAFGFAGAVKAPALLPVIVMLAMCAPQIRGRLTPFAAGVAAGFTLPNLPFIVAAPGAWWHDVLITQLMRIPGTARVPAGTRLSDITAAPDGGAAPVIVVAVALVLVVAAFTLKRSTPKPLALFALAGASVVAVAQFVPEQYYPQYAAFLAPFLALLTAVVAHRLSTLRAPRAEMGLAVVIFGALVATALWSVHDRSARDSAQAIQTLVPAGACTLSDSPKYLVTSDRFIATSAACPAVTDPFGTSLASGDARINPQLWLSTFSAVDYIVTDTPLAGWYIHPGATLLRYVADNFHISRDDGLLIYVRRGSETSVTIPTRVRGSH